MTIRQEFNGMLPGAIVKFESLMLSVSGLNPVIAKGYDCSAGRDSFFAWGCAAQITCDNMTTLRSEAEAIGITWLDDNGSMTYTNGLDIEDFQTYRVNGNLELMPAEEGM